MEDLLQQTGGDARRRQYRGERTRQQILEAAVDLASTEGLEGLTIGRLATVLSMSKSGLFAHFGSKEDLQLATVDMAAEVFKREVVRPALEAERGLPRLNAMLEGWLSYIERSVFRGGCFFSAAAAEFDDRPGPVRDMVAGLMKAWLDALADEVAKAESLGQLDAGGDPEQIAFEVHALVQGANWASRLLGDEKALVRARAAIRRRLEGAAA